MSLTLADLQLHVTAVLSPDDRALLLSSPALPVFSATQPEHVPGPNADTEMLYIAHMTEVIISSQLSNDLFPLR